MLQKFGLQKPGLRKLLFSITAAFITLSVLVYGVIAQSEEPETPAVSVQPGVTVESVTAANVVQTVPVTLTLTIPSPSGPITVEVPVFLSLDIRIGISSGLTTTVAVTPSVATEVEATPTATLEIVDEATAESTTEAITETSTEAITEEATAPPTALPPADTPLPDEVAPIDVPLPTATPTATVTTEPVAVAAACPDPRAVITSPGNGQAVSGAVQIVGTATHENFQYYKVEYAQGENVDPNDTFSYLADARVQVSGSLLTAFDSTGFANGAYTFKLSVVDNSGNFPPPCTVSVVIQN